MIKGLPRDFVPREAFFSGILLGGVGIRFWIGTDKHYKQHVQDILWLVLSIGANRQDIAGRSWHPVLDRHR